MIAKKIRRSRKATLKQSQSHFGRIRSRFRLILEMETNISSGSIKIGSRRLKSTHWDHEGYARMVAAKLRRAPRLAIATGGFNMMAAYCGSCWLNRAKIAVGTGDQNSLLIVMTAERGLCGGFNGNIAKACKARAKTVVCGRTAGGPDRWQGRDAVRRGKRLLCRSR
jgi:hypothetical protein